ncbi:hypothetical protein ABPG72_010499 [Tetrahymena utriculariae]
MQNFRIQEYNIPFGYVLSNCQGICLDLGCSGTMRLIPCEQWKSQFNKSLNKGKFLAPSTCFLSHNHQEKIAKIDDILEKKYENLKIFQSNLKKLQDFTQILVQIENSFTNMKQISSLNFKDQQFQNFCTKQAQKITSFYNQMEANYFQEQLRAFLIEYQENSICYKQLLSNVNQLIEEFNYIEKNIYSHITNYIYKGIQIRNAATTSQNVFELIIKFSNQANSFLTEILRKIIQNHASRLENQSYFSIDSFQYFQIVVRIFKKYFINFLQPKDKQNLIDQLIKFSKYFLTIFDIQNTLVCYKYSLEINPEISDLYLQLAKIFKKQEDLDSVQKVYCLGLYYFPQKTSFLQGLLESCHTQEQSQISLIKEYQFQLTQKPSSEFQLLSMLFKSINSNASSLFQQFCDSDTPQKILENLRTQLLAKNLNFKNLNPIQKFKIAYESKPNPQLQIIEHKTPKLQNSIQNLSLYEQYCDLLTPLETHSNITTQLLAKNNNLSISKSLNKQGFVEDPQEKIFEQIDSNFQNREKEEILQIQKNLQEQQKTQKKIQHKRKIIKKAAQCPPVKKIEVIEIFSDKEDAYEEEEEKQSLQSNQSLSSNSFPKECDSVQIINQNILKIVNRPEIAKSVQDIFKNKILHHFDQNIKENSNIIRVQQYLINNLS